MKQLDIADPTQALEAIWTMTKQLRLSHDEWMALIAAHETVAKELTTPVSL